MALLCEYSFNSIGSPGGTLASSGTIPDSSGNGHTLVALTDVDLVTGKNGVGIIGDGFTEIQLSSTSAIKPTTAVTWMCWAKVTGNTYGWGQIFGRCNDDTAWGETFSFYMDSANNSSYGFMTVIQSNTTSWQYYNVNTVLTLNTWVHLAATWSAADGNIRIYKDGSLVMVAAHAGSTLYYGSGGNTTKHFDIFLNEQYTERGNQIQIDDVRVFDTQLDATAITTYMNTPAGNNTTAPLAWLRA